MDKPKRFVSFNKSPNQFMTPGIEKLINDNLILREDEPMLRDTILGIEAGFYGPLISSHLHLLSDRINVGSSRDTVYEIFADYRRIQEKVALLGNKDLVDVDQFERYFREGKTAFSQNLDDANSKARKLRRMIDDRSKSFNYSNERYVTFKDLIFVAMIVERLSDTFELLHLNTWVRLIANEMERNCQKGFTQSVFALEKTKRMLDNPSIVLTDDDMYFVKPTLIIRNLWEHEVSPLSRPWMLYVVNVCRELNFTILFENGARAKSPMMIGCCFKDGKLCVPDDVYEFAPRYPQSEPLRLRTSRKGTVVINDLTWDSPFVTKPVGEPPIDRLDNYKPLIRKVASIIYNREMLLFTILSHASTLGMITSDAALPTTAEIPLLPGAFAGDINYASSKMNPGKTNELSEMSNPVDAKPGLVPEVEEAIEKVRAADGH